jgi:hypothetical protein
MYEMVENLGRAETLENLGNKVKKAISLAGEDARWRPYGDGKICIYSKDNKTMVVIRQPLANI